MITKIKNVLVTGASRGIGLNIAKKFNIEKYNIFTVSTRPWINKDFKPHKHFAVNLENEFELNEFCNKIRSSHIDILINNAGINKISPFIEIHDSDFKKVLDVNLFAPFKICKAILPNMKKNNWGRIVNMSSIWGLKSKEYRASYSSSKFAIDGLTTAIALEFSQHNVLANSIAPGFIDTELTRSVLNDNQINELTQKVPMKRMGGTKEIAEFVFWLCSENNTYITGQNIPIDGGYTSA